MTLYWLWVVGVEKRQEDVMCENYHYDAENWRNASYLWMRFMSLRFLSKLAEMYQEQFVKIAEYCTLFKYWKLNINYW